MKHSKKSLYALIVLMAVTFVSARAEGGVPYLTKAEFEKKVTASTDVTNLKFVGDKPTIIDFTASWCPPCKKLAPILDQLYTAHKEKINIFKVDVDNEKELATTFKVKSIPTMLFINKEGKVESTIGLLSKEAIEKKINEFLLK